MMDATKQIWAHCKSCGHTWSAARLPMEATKMVKLMRRFCCPSCAETGKNLFMANQVQVDKAIADMRAEIAELEQ